MFALLLACAAIDALLIVAQALCLATALTWMWDCTTAGTAEHLVIGALPGALGFASAFIARNALDTLRSGLADRYSRQQGAELQTELVSATYDQGAAGVQRRGSGSAVQELIDGIANVRNYIAIILPKLADLIVIPVILAIALFAVDWISGVIALAVLPCILGYMRLLGAHAKAQAAAQHEEYDRLANHFMDTLRGLPTLKVFGRSKPYAKQVFDVSEAFRDATVKTLRTATLSSLVLDLFRTFALAAVAIMLGFRLLNGSAQLESALAVLIMVPEYFAAVRRYSTDFHASLDGRSSLASILRTINEPKADVGARAQQTKLQAWSAESTLELRNVSYRHNAEGPLTLDDVSFAVHGACRIGIVGLSGSGKATLTQLLAGFTSPSSGEVVVDGIALSTLNFPAWQRQVTYIPQNPHIFNATLHDNVAFYVPDASDAEVNAAIQLAGLDELVAKLPQGLDTMLGQQGRQLSGGQAQRVTLARAFLDTQRKVLIFDEPTAHLDIQTELALKERMLPLMEGKLVYFATHRLHWLENMDQVLVVEDGHIVESGEPHELMASGGALSQLIGKMRGGELL
mgnify:FL=1